MRIALVLLLCLIFGNREQPDTARWDFDLQLREYLAQAVRQCASNTAAGLASSEHWDSFRLESQFRLREMLGLSPWPERGDLSPQITGTIEHEEFTVERIHFQSISGLYVTGNLYIPRDLKGPAPTILYVCGHATVTINGYNYGSKSHYQHHPAWFARNGYVCLILDTLQLAEIEGIHHGTYRYNRWWWLSRGYTPAGVETWNGIRALDYLFTRPEVDTTSIGLTGRSGGGAISWYLAALDDRVTTVVPVAGITDLEDHVVNGCVEGHCDCMFPINLSRWDFGQIAAMIAPRPLLISNTDRDPIFPLQGVYRTYQMARTVYHKLGAAENLGFHITAGVHQDVQELRVHAFQWFNKHLQNRNQLIDKTAIKFFKPEELRVFNQLPADQKNTKIDEIFTPVARSASERLSRNTWTECKRYWQQILSEVIFQNWPEHSPKLSLIEQYTDGQVELKMLAIDTDGITQLPLFYIRNGATDAKQGLKIIFLDDYNAPLWMDKLSALAPDNHFVKSYHQNEIGPDHLMADLQENSEIILLTARGCGLASYAGDDQAYNHIRRRFPLVGQSLEMMQTWDIFQAISMSSSISNSEAPVTVEASGLSASMLIYAMNFIKSPMQLNLSNITSSHYKGPHYPGILRHMDIDATLLLVSDLHNITLRDCPDSIARQMFECRSVSPSLKQPIIID